MQQTGMRTACGSTNLADLVERLLDKGLVIAGDIRIKLVDVELLSIQIRLVICSVEKATEIGLDWWNHKPRRRRRRPATQPTLPRKAGERVLAGDEGPSSRRPDSPSGLEV